MSPISQIKVPATYMRGGTSKGVFFRLKDLPGKAQVPLRGMRDGSTRPAWIANAPAAVERLPQLPLQSTKALSIETCP